ncbi:gamma-glutamyltranspeptidase/glutathione hydrolase [Natronocella acetinitrilica]|uniref:Glutathione hydrolase proenzyme n=1 Tax=Natronocella acetinitrilica TaxID=414046 RepID=A0AAE3G1Y0_9GAMM|nr:gamma-glutamyltransferase [Natronocella acetinitrilica]MCP1673226.1 gamma-glutamyltranspeptidase/glutathione hydrolase [Natronocella acetinitrilica]
MQLRRGSHGRRTQGITVHGRHSPGLALALPLILVLGLAPPVAGGLGLAGADGGVVTTSEPAAAQAGAQILRDGGNAIDAAAAVMFALNLLEPQSSGIGGGGFMMIHLADSGETLIVDSRETAPAAASVDMLEGHSFPVASTSGIAVGVPGAVRGVELALDTWGTMGFDQVLAPAIALAEGGFPVSRRLADSLTHDRLTLEQGDPAYDEARRVFHPDGEPLTEGAWLTQPDFARTLRLLAEQGPDAFYTGELAEAIVETQRHHRGDDAELAGRMTLDDLAAYTAAVRDPVVGTYRGYRIAGMPSPSSGGLTMLAVLGMLERFPIGSEAAGFGAGDVATLHVMLEAMRLAFADRGVWMGDEDFVDVPTAALIHPDYLAQRSALIDVNSRLDSVEANDPRPVLTGEQAERLLARVVEMHPEPENTTHFSIVDRHGNVVSYTNTIESAWGTGLMVPGYGFLLNNELTDFNFTPQANDDPEAYDPGANDIAPGKRPRSSMAPTMIFDGDRPVAAFGSPGGATIINSVINVTMALIDHELNAQEAVDLPRISKTTERWPTTWEAGFQPSVIEGLRDLGHDLRPGPMDIGSVQLVIIDPETGLQYGAADRRRIGGVVSLGLPDTANQDD